MKIFLTLLSLAGFVLAASAQVFSTTLFAEGFENLVLAPNVDEPLAGSAVWTKTPPAGWTQNDSGVPTGGVTEWRGWSFASKTWWAQTAADQNRSLFTKGQGTVAVADPDEWDDLAHQPGLMNTFLSTPPISIAGVAANSIQVRFDSSWRQEGEQAANLTVSYDGGAAIEILRFDSNQSSPNFKPDAPNESILLTLNNPGNNSSMVLTFGLLNAGNNWWWAFDNLEVTQSSIVLSPAGHWIFASTNIGGNVVTNLVGTPPGNISGTKTLYQGAGTEAIWLDGASTYVELAGTVTIGQLPPRAITLEAWVVLASPETYGGIIGALQDNGGFEKGWVLGYDNSRFNFGLSTAGAADADGVMTYLAATTPFALKQWYHVVGTYDGTSQKIYVNGQLTGTSTVQSGDINYPAAAPYVIGAYRDDNEFFRLHGLIREVRIYNRTLDATEVQSHFQSMSSLTGHTVALPDDVGCTTAVPRTDSPFGNKRVLVIGIDGCRVDSLIAANTPNLDGLAASGAFSYQGTTSIGQPTVSGPGWSTILTGVWSDKHRVNNNSFSNPDYATYPHFFTRLRQAQPNAYLCSIVHWSPINQYILSDETVEFSGLADAQVAAQAVCQILQAGPDAIFLHFDDLDAAGHGGGYHPGNPNYLATLNRLDGYIGDVLGAVYQRKRTLGEDWLVIFCSDHGGTAGGSHGGQTLEEVRVPLIINGGSTHVGEILPPPYNTDIVPSIFAHLGIEVPAAWGLDGRTRALSVPLSISLAGGNVVLRWPGIVQLQRSPDFGNWTNATGAYSPFRITPSLMFELFRLAP